MRGGALYVLVRAAGYALCLLLAHVAHAFGRDADDEAQGWKRATRRDDPTIINTVCHEVWVDTVNLLKVRSQVS